MGRPQAGRAARGRGPGPDIAALPSAAPALHATAPHVFRSADFTSHPASADARFIADWVADSGDSRGLPFIILDKRDARLFVFGAEGRLIDSSPVLLGATPGDDSVADIGTRPMACEDEKTTPAGRFIAGGQNASHEDVVGSTTPTRCRCTGSAWSIPRAPPRAAGLARPG